MFSWSACSSSSSLSGEIGAVDGDGLGRQATIDEASYGERLSRTEEDALNDEGVLVATGAALRFPPFLPRDDLFVTSVWYAHANSTYCCRRRTGSSDGGSLT